MTTTIHPDDDPMNVASVVIPDSRPAHQVAAEDGRGPSGRYLWLPPAGEHSLAAGPEPAEALSITATRLADFAMKMATGYSPDLGDPRRLAIYRQILSFMEEAEARAQAQRRQADPRRIARLACEAVSTIETEAGLKMEPGQRAAALGAVAGAVQRAIIEALI